MNWPTILHCAWHGVRGAVIAGATAWGFIGARMPTNYEWLGMGFAALVGFVNGAESGYSEPGGKAA